MCRKAPMFALVEIYDGKLLAMSAKQKKRKKQSTSKLTTFQMNSLHPSEKRTLCLLLEIDATKMVTLPKFRFHTSRIWAPGRWHCDRVDITKLKKKNMVRFLYVSIGLNRTQTWICSWLWRTTDRIRQVRNPYVGIATIKIWTQTKIW